MEKVISNDATVISYTMSGEGPPLILVHGTTAGHTSWHPLLPFLEDNFTVCTIDRRGRGESGDSTDYSSSFVEYIIRNYI